MKVNEIFVSVDGEVNAWGQGGFTTFVRLQGCNLYCKWCFGSPPGRKQPKVMLSRGSKKKLKEVEKGDVILTYDEEFNIVETTVMETHAREVDRWLRITIEGVQYFVTHGHPFMTPKGIVNAENLKVGDDIYHVKPGNIISFKKLGDRNPMKNAETALKSASNTDYVKMGQRLSKTIREKQAKGTYVHPGFTDEGRKRISESKLGSKNPNWKGGSKTPNCDKLVKTRKTKTCKCGSSRYMEVHHIDENPANDKPGNLITICKSCHTKIHKKGYNFWNGERRDGKQLMKAVGNNGMKVQAIKEFDRNSYPPSLRPKPLKVYNLTCSPHNTYFLDGMWVHNCDTPRAQGLEGGKDMNVHGVYNEIVKLGVPKVTITGGEPFYEQAQETIDLILMLDTQGFRVSIETNGSFPVRCWLPRTDNISVVFDYKLEYEDKMVFHPNLLSKMDYIKIVIGSADQYEQAKKIVATKLKNTEANIYFSPVRPRMDPAVLVHHMRKDQLFNVGVNLQIHKCIWADGVEY